MRNRFNLKLDTYDSEIGAFTDNFLMAKGGGSKTVVKPSKEQAQIFQKKLDLANKLENQGILEFYPDETLSPESQWTGVGQNMQLGSAWDVSGLSPEIQDAYSRGINMDVVGDPRTEAMVDAALRPITQNYQETVIPQLDDMALQADAFGGDRHRLFQGKAAGEYMNAIGDTSAELYSDAFRSSLDHQLGMFGQTPTMIESVTAPSGIVQDVGAQQEARGQAEIDADRERWDFEQYALTDLVNRVNAPLSNIDFGSVTKQSGGGKK